MELFIFDTIVGLLEDGDVVTATFMEITVFIDVQRIDFHTNVTEVFAGGFDGVADLGNV